MTTSSMWRFLIYNASVQCYIDDPHMAGFSMGDMPVSSVVIMTVTIGYADGWRMEASS